MADCKRGGRTATTEDGQEHGGGMPGRRLARHLQAGSDIMTTHVTTMTLQVSLTKLMCKSSITRFVHIAR